MDTKEHIKTAINKIEFSISEKIDIEQLSSECFVSPRQLYRDFYSLTGHSVNEYIRKRRITKALSLLKHSDMTIADIAYSCGYSSQQALCKSIKSIILMTPAEYRNHQDTYYFPVSGAGKAKQITVENKSMPKMICLKYYQSKLKDIENNAVNCLNTVFADYNGKIYGRNGHRRGNQFCYELLIEYSEKYIDAVDKTDYKSCTVTSPYNSVFAYTTAENTEQDINAAWDYLYGHWLKNSMFEPDTIPYFEEYILKDRVIKKLILHLPIKKRVNLHKINIRHFEDRLFIVSAKSGRGAEKSAAGAVTGFISDNHAYLLNTQKEFYVFKQKSLCVCGMRLDNPLYLPNDGSVELLTAPKGLYAVLEGSCYGSGDEYEQILLGWLRENGFETEGPPFSIYDTTLGTDQSRVTVKSQVRIKLAE